MLRFTAIQVEFAAHVVGLLVGQLPASVRNDVEQLRGGDEAVAIAVEDLEGLVVWFGLVLVDLCVLYDRLSWFF